MIQLRYSPGHLEAVVFCCLAGLVLAGCTVGPDYKRPKSDMPPKWSEGSNTGETLPEVELTRWWTVFKDVELDSLIGRSAQNNKDLKLAEARIREARAQRGVVAAGAYPTVETAANYSYSHFSEYGPSSGRNEKSPDLYQAGFDAKWELDFFGGVRRAVEAANADIQASEEMRRDVLVTLFAEVARNYLEVRGLQLRLSIAHGNIKLQRQTLELTRERFAAGLSSELEVAQARAQLSNTEALVPALESAERQGIHRLSVLLGLAPGALLEELVKAAPIPTAPPEVPVGLPSDLLRRRPDIRGAERQLAAATARIGAATADLFPKFSLTGALGQQSFHLVDLAASGSTFWSMGPTITWPIFEGGKIRSNIQVQDARQEQALITYEKVVLTALRDVEDALVAYIKEQTTRRSLAQSLEATRLAFEIANELYSKGLVDFLNVLESQRSLQLTQDQLAQSDQRITTNLVALFKALGGGWSIPD